MKVEENEKKMFVVGTFGRVCFGFCGNGIFLHFSLALERVEHERLAWGRRG